MPIEGAQEFATEVAASPDDCFAVIVDFESYPRWSSAVKEISVLERNAAGLAREVEFRIATPIKSIRYVLRYSYRKPTGLTWRSTDGDVESIEGAYSFRKRGAGRTEVCCRQAVRVGFWVPGPLRRLLEANAVRDSVLEFKGEVERRSGPDVEAPAKPRTTPTRKA